MKAMLGTISIAVAGFVVIVAGIAMLVLPGPGWLTIFAGLAIWSKRFAWAETLRAWLVRKVRAAAATAKRLGVRSFSR